DLHYFSIRHTRSSPSSFRNLPPSTDFYTLSLTTLFRSLIYGIHISAHGINIPDLIPEFHIIPLRKKCRFKGTKQAWNILFHGYRSEEHTSELQSRFDIVCRLLLEKKKRKIPTSHSRSET